MAASSTSKFNVTPKIQHYCEFEWHFDTFSIVNRNLRSPQFSAADYCPVKWILMLELENQHQSIKMKIKFEISDKTLKNLKAKFCYKIFRGAQLITDSSTVDDIFPHAKESKQLHIAVPFYDLYDPYNGFARRNNLQTDKMKFYGYITVNNCCQKKPEVLELTNKYLPQLQSDFKSLLKNQEFTDVSLNLGNEIIRAHKFVLCARSQVFKKMFQQNFKESAHNSVNVEDMEKSVMESFLVFLYSGNVADRSFKTVQALYSAADRYDVKTLQEACQEILISCMSENTAPVILKLADMHNDNKLKEIAVEYICSNFVKVELTTEWGQLLDTDPRLASYTLRRVSANVSKE